MKSYLDNASSFQRYPGTAESGDPYQLLQNLQTAAKATIATQKKKIHLEKQSLEKEIAEARSQAPVYENQCADVNTDEFLYNLQKEAGVLQCMYYAVDHFQNN